MREKLAELIGGDVQWADDCVGVDTSHLQPGQLLLLENLRFHAGEEKNDPPLRRSSASWRTLRSRRLWRLSSRPCLDRSASPTMPDDTRPAANCCRESWSSCRR